MSVICSVCFEEIHDNEWIEFYTIDKGLTSFTHVNCVASVYDKIPEVARDTIRRSAKIVNTKHLIKN